MHEWTHPVVMNTPRMPTLLFALTGCLAGVERREQLQHGEQLFTDKGCVTCHTVDGTARVGPSLKGTFGKPVACADGREQVVDEAYIRESILQPQAHARAGYPPAMPANYGDHLDAGELDALVAYIRSR
jgi:cytochrome c oxidase subunit II